MSDDALSYLWLQRKNRTGLQSVWDFKSHLVDTLAGVVCVHVCVLRAEMPPLEAVHWPQVSLFPVRHHIPLLQLNPQGEQTV